MTTEKSTACPSWFDLVQGGAPIVSWLAFWGALMGAKQKPFFYRYLSAEMKEQLDSFQQRFEDYTPEQILEALQKEAFQRSSTFAQGFSDLWSKAMPPAPQKQQDEEQWVLWQQGSTRLLDLSRKYALPLPKSQAPSLLMVPSLLNRGWIFDLKPTLSFSAFLAQQGIRPLVLEWGNPEEAERHFSLKDYLEHRLMPLLTFLGQDKDLQLFMLGYCMGGLMAMAAASQYSSLKGLALMGVPWNFEAMPQPPHPWHSYIKKFLQAGEQHKQPIPSSLIQGYFQMLAWPEIGHKMRAWLQINQQDQDDMLPLERWLHQGNSLTHAVAKECYESWYLTNKPHKNREIAGKVINFDHVKWPLWGAIGTKDQVVPHIASHPLQALFKQGNFIFPDLGHLGFFSSHRAKQNVWAPLAQWIGQHHKKS